jgi:hypothetical protein
MHITDLATPFLSHYKNEATYFEQTFEHHPDVYNFYFTRHCYRKEEKLQVALATYSNRLNEMQEVTSKILHHLPKITSYYESFFQLSFNGEAHLFVGLGGSNAYTTHSLQPGLGFCVEKIRNDEASIRVLIAHELGHCVHHYATFEAKGTVYQIDWGSPYTWLLQEGLATYLSMQAVNVERHFYFVSEGDKDWLAFVQQNKALIFKRFRKDLALYSTEEIFKEWFSINGGNTFGYTRLAYFIGFELVSKIVEQNGLDAAILFWLQPEYKNKVIQLLISETVEATFA